MRTVPHFIECLLLCLVFICNGPGRAGAATPAPISRHPEGTMPTPGAAARTGKFVPPQGRTLLLIGQDVASIDGYLREIGPRPAGFMIYTGTASVTGLSRSINYGAGTCHAAHYTKEPQYARTVLQLGIYINANWDAQRMWKGQGWGDCRLQSNGSITARWRQEMSSERYLQADDDLFGLLGYPR
jgi:hypothetical protein